MSQFKDAALGDTVYFWFAANLTTGAAGDGATPLYDVRLAGAAAGAAPVLSGTPTLLTHADYTDGLHEIAVAATEGNGFAAGNEYAVFCTLTISTVNPAGFVGSFKLVASGDTLHAGMATLMDRVLGTIDTGTHKPQGGDAYAIANNGTYGNSALKTLLDTTGIKVATNADKTGYALTSAYDAAKTAGTSTLTAQQVWEYATRVLTASTNLGILDAAAIRTAIGLASANLDTQIDGLPTAAEIKTALEAAGGYLALIKTAVDLIEDINRNQMEITDANGNLVLRADNGTDALYSVAGCITDNLTTTIRKRLE